MVTIVGGKAQNNSDFTLMNARSIAENVTYSVGSEEDLFTGRFEVINGVPQKDNLVVSGMSLVHSAKLTTIAFTRGYFGDFGQYIVSVGLLLFAFSTAIAWSYYGDRSTAYIFGEKGVIWYRILYVFCFFLASIIDTEVVWNIAYVVVALVTIPNLIGLIVLRKEIKTLSDEYKI